MELCLETMYFRQPLRNAAQGTTPDEILTTAVGRGIRCFDTAGAYDEAERILGRFLKYQKRQDDFILTTKIRPNTLRNVSPAHYKNALLQDLAGSLRCLGFAKVNATLLHNADFLRDELALDALASLKDEGVTEKVGVCVATPMQFEVASAAPQIDVIQISYNVFDTRLDELLRRTNKEIQAGGVFLKGLLFRTEDEVPEHMWEAKTHLHTLAAYEEREGVSRAELAITFAKTQPKINQLIIAVENAAQLSEDCDHFTRTGNTVALRELTDQIGGVDERIVQPSLWRGEYR